jgi:DNA-directed RNA polymerase subunit K/omega
MNSKKNNITNLLDEISSIFIPDYNLIVNSELHVLQIHRLVWLAAVRATQRQRGNDQYQKRMQPEQLLSNALDEIVKNKTVYLVLKDSFFFSVISDKYSN